MTDLETKIWAACREADEAFEAAGEGGTKTWFRDHFLPSLKNHGLVISAEKKDFGWALEKMKAGEKVCRRAWSNEGWRIDIYPPEHAGYMDLAFIYVSSSNRDRVPWSATHQDILATDWEIWGD